VGGRSKSAAMVSHSLCNNMRRCMDEKSRVGESTLIADYKVITACERRRRVVEQLRLKLLSNLKGWLTEQSCELVHRASALQLRTIETLSSAGLLKTSFSQLVDRLYIWVTTVRQLCEGPEST